MVKIRTYSHRDSERILKEKGLYQEIMEIVRKTPSLGTGAHNMISGFLGEKGWNLEVNLLKGTRYQQDAYKQGVLLEIDLRGSLLDSVHRNFLRSQVLYNSEVVDVLVQITEMDREPKYNAMKRDIELFKSVLSVPIYLIGLGG